MERSAENFAKAGFIALLLLIVIAALGWYWSASGKYTTYQILTQDAVSGLLVDAPVEFHGVEVGKVKRIDLASPNTVNILLQVRKETPVTSATVATIITRGLTNRGFMGYVYISLEDTGIDASPLKKPPGSQFPRIATARSNSLTLDTTMNQVNAKVDTIMALTETVLNKQSIDAMHRSLDALQQITETLAANNKKLSMIILNTEQASSQIKPLLDSGNNTVNALQNQILPQAYKTLSEMDKLSRTLDGVAVKINRDPSLLIRGGSRSVPGPGEGNESR
jgi:phospholipid/cholesterol/gamma-HCH transport system substrate-binding protein